MARFHIVPDPACIVATISEQHARTGHIVRHHQVQTEIVRCLARRYLCPHGKAVRVDEEMDLGREATWRTAESRAVAPPRSPLHQAPAFPPRPKPSPQLATSGLFNNRRLLEPIGNIPPAEAEANFYAAMETEPLAA